MAATTSSAVGRGVVVEIDSLEFHSLIPNAEVIISKTPRRRNGFGGREKRFEVMISFPFIKPVGVNFNY